MIKAIKTKRCPTMNIRLLTLCALMGAAPLAQAGFFDVLQQATQVAKNVQSARDAVAPAATVTAPAAAASTAVDAQALQAYMAMDCASLQALHSGLSQQVAPATATAAKASGLLNAASGLLGFASRMGGVPTDALQQAANVTQQAQQLAQTATTQTAATSNTPQLAALQAVMSAKTCQ